MNFLKTVWTVSILLALMPFMPQPHLWQKLKLLTSGYLKNPEDWLDLLWHGGGLVFAIIFTTITLVKNKIEKGKEEK